MNRYQLFIGISLWFLCCVAPVAGQTWGAGFRLGDPSGISVKKYLGGKAFELNVGRTHAVHVIGQYNKRFYDWYDKQGIQYDELNLEGYRASTPIAAQLHYLIRNKLGKASATGGRLEWYYGFGGQVRFNTYYYQYRYKPKGGGAWVYVEDDRVPNIDFGADAVIGLEYLFKGPFSLFLDVNLFMEVVNNPFSMWMQGGLGGRYRF